MKCINFWICNAPSQGCSIEKKLLPVVKTQNGGCIQDDVENVFNFHPVFSKMIICKFSSFNFG
jgi:hypothetical protein